MKPAYDYPSEQFKAFRRELEARGVTMRRLWEARRDGRKPTPTKPCDVVCYSFHGAGFAPSIAIAIIVDYGGKDGFGTFVDSLPMDLAELAAAIAKPREAAQTAPPPAAAPSDVFDLLDAAMRQDGRT